MATFKDGSGAKDGKEIFALLNPTEGEDEDALNDPIDSDMEEQMLRMDDAYELTEFELEEYRKEYRENYGIDPEDDNDGDYDDYDYRDFDGYF